MLKSLSQSLFKFTARRIYLIRTMAGDVPKSDLYPEIDPYNKGMLSVSDVHSVYYEESGNKSGKPAIFIHGGPGGGTGPNDRRFFDPAVYRIVLMDQRGSGNSTPPAELKDNTTWHLVSDIEKLREHLGVDKWHVVFGGSWGSTLSLAYSQTHPDRVGHLVLRGIFTLRRKELEWFYQDGASRMYPDIWDEYLAVIPEVERHDLMSAYYRHLTGEDKAKQQACARAWSKWEMHTSRLVTAEEDLEKADSDLWSLQFARIECHYFVHGGFFKSDAQLIDEVDKIRHIPAVIVQGRYDLVCPMDTAWELHKRWPEADFKVVHAGHSAREDLISAELVKACERFKAA